MDNARPLVALAVSLTAALTFAEEVVRQQGAHRHGVGRLNAAVENDALYVELVLPGEGVVGFEHAPRTDRERRVVAEAVRTLEHAANVLAFPAQAGCQLVHARVETAMLGEEHPVEHAQGADETGHERDHGDGAPAAPGEHGHDRHTEQMHSEFRVGFEFRCSEALEFVDVVLFDHFGATEVLEVQVIGWGGQTAVAVTTDSRRLRF